MGTTRSLRKLQKLQDNNSITVRQIGNYSSKWNWVHRAEKWDEHIILQDELRKQEEWIHEENILITNARKLNEVIQETLEDLRYVDSTKATSVAHSLDSLAKALKNANDVLRVNYGRSTSITDNKTQLEADIDSKVDVKAKLSQTQEILSKDEFREYELRLLNAINKKQRSNK